MQMTDWEVATSYRLAKDRRHQIGVLAELNACGREDIVAALERTEERVGRAGRARARLTEAELAMIRELHTDGKSNTEIAEALGITAQTVSTRLKRLGPPANIGRRSPETRRMQSDGKTDPV